jgi:hypothetical protein
MNELQQEKRNLYNEDKENYPDPSYIVFHTNPIYSDYEIEIKRTQMGHYCVYMKLPVGHPDIGKDYNEFDLNIHGGLTYGENSIFGIDFAHYSDYIPFENMGIEFVDPNPDSIVWTFDMVKAEGFKMVELFYGRANIQG